MIIPPFEYFTAYTPTVPKLYWDVKSQEQRIKDLFCTLDKLVQYSDVNIDQINANTQAIAELQAQFQKFIDSGFFDYYADQLEKWIRDNAASIISEMIKMVFFGLTSTGYFCAYIPESWSDITFDTGAIYGTEEYGRLILKYRVDGEGVIDNTGTETIQELVNDIATLKKLVARNSTTLYKQLRAGE